VKQLFSIFLFSCLFYACQTDLPNEFIQTPYKLNLPPGFPPPPIPGDNLLTEQRVLLGKKLFFDPILSRDSTIACGSCHLPGYAFSDNLPLSLGVNNRQGVRNTPSLANIAYAPVLLRDGGKSSLEAQIINPIEAHNEMDFTILELLEKLGTNEEYVVLFENAYGRKPDLFALSRALAAFERTLISGNSRYDRFFYSHENDALSSTEKRGMGIFFGEKANCSGCHGGFNFTNNTFQNNGLYLEYADKGRGSITFREEDNGKFRIPTLRNIELTAPYMHDGSLKSIEEVIEHYLQGGKGHANQSELIEPFSLTEAEQQDLIQFLKSLTDYDFVNNSQFVP
jgi:cytochrome c peroxidase